MVKSGKYLEELATIDNPHFMRERKMLSKQILYCANVSLELNVILFASGLKVVLPLLTICIPCLHLPTFLLLFLSESSLQYQMDG